MGWDWRRSRSHSSWTESIRRILASSPAAGRSLACRSSTDRSRMRAGFEAALASSAPTQRSRSSKRRRIRPPPESSARRAAKGSIKGVCATRGGTPGLCPHNADSFLRPYGPPVLQVSSEEASFLNDHAQRGTEIALVASIARTKTTAFNVVSTIRSKRRSSAARRDDPAQRWYWCASERGGGIACWLELMRTLLARRPARDVVFVASSGHELGHLGIDAFVGLRPEIVRSRASAGSISARTLAPRVRPGLTTPRLKRRSAACHAGDGAWDDHSGFGRRVRGRAESRHGNGEPRDWSSQSARSNPWRRGRSRSSRRWPVCIGDRKQCAVPPSGRSRIACGRPE